VEGVLYPITPPGVARDTAVCLAQGLKIAFVFCYRRLVARALVACGFVSALGGALAMACTGAKAPPQPERTAICTAGKYLTLGDISADVLGGRKDFLTSSVNHGV
jgi:hypothetical protein